MKRFPTAQDELDTLRTLAAEVELFLWLTDTDEHILREHRDILKKLHELAVTAKIYRKTVSPEGTGGGG